MCDLWICFVKGQVRLFIGSCVVVITKKKQEQEEKGGNIKGGGERKWI